MAADGGNCTASREIVDSLSREQPGLAFTREGLADTLTAPAMALQVAAIEWACGRRDAARARWGRLARGFAEGGPPMTIAIADAARRRLGNARTAADRVLLEKALNVATGTLESGGTSNPGLLEYARAALLAALGRVDEARESLRRVFVFPDRNLSHALARAELRHTTARAAQ
jgi:hypothetical protein